MSELPPLSLHAGLEQFIVIYMPSRNFARKTREEYTRDVGELVAFLVQEGIEEWSQVGLQDLQAHLANLDALNLKASTRNRKTYAIKTFFNCIAENGYLEDNPADRLIPPKIPSKEPRFLSAEEYNTLLAQITSARDRAIVTLFLQTGLRLSELAKLQMSDLQLPKRVTRDPENVGMVKVNRKGSKVEYLPLNWKACDALAAWLRQHRNKYKEKATTTFVFLNKYGEPLSPRSIQRMVKKYLKRAGIEDATVHTLRHTMATHYAAKGGDIKSIQEMLGHASLETTQIYVSLAKKVQQQMVQNLAL